MISRDDLLIKNPLLYYVKAFRRDFLIGMFFLFITNGLDAYWPLLLKKAIDQVAAKSPMQEITQTCIFFFSILAVLAITRFLWRTFFGRYHTMAAEDIRNKLFHKLTEMGPSYFRKNPVGEIMSLIINDVQSFRQALGQAVLVLIDGIIVMAFVLPMMIYLQPSWTWKTLVFLPLVPFMIQRMSALIFKYYKVQQDHLSSLSGFSQEIVAGIRVVKGFAQEKNKLNQYNQLSSTYEKSSNKTNFVDALWVPVMEFGVASGSVILLFVAAPDVLSGIASVGTFVAFQRYIQKMVWPVTALGFGISAYQKGMASFARIKDVLLLDTDIPDTGKLKLEQFENLKVHNLDFQYPDGTEKCLKDINLEIKQGETIGIVGPVGSGKSTLLNLLTRLYPSHPNQITLNGVSVEKFRLHSLRSHVVLVPQEVFLFSETIAENMSFGLETTASETQLRTWSKRVDLESEIDELPQKFDSPLGERGVNLSGGQKQRLAIARGMMTQASVLLLDDVLSAVDVKTESEIQNQINQSKSKGQALVMVSHRLNTVIHADKIVVMKEGQIEAVGRHHDLISASPTYRKMAEIQGYVV